MKEKKDIRLTVEKEFPEFSDIAKALNEEGIQRALAGLAKSSQDVQDAKEADEELEDARTTAHGLAAPYKDATKAIKLKTQYLLSLMKDRGQA